MSSNIQVFLRVRPSARPAPGFEADTETGTLRVELDNANHEALPHGKPGTHTFSFASILEKTTKQQEVLEKVAKPVIEDVLKGLNGTIFAYGQTGSGKTFTITGGAERYEDRGLIPRTIAYLFDTFRRSESQYKMYISYLEIYQDKGYDLLREGGAKLEDLPKVHMQEDSDGHFHLKNLSVNVASSQEEALNLLFLGDTNRIVAETPMNDASTRSHCLFIIWVESSTPGSDVIRRSKLHLVDLAGSERVGQTGVEGKLLKEATAINQSLHFLERVIVALHSRARGEQMHIPYRDSMMTSVLRDSLGGNCKTTMIACVAAEAANLPETISTCRFAQRVAQIKNSAKVNEELDPTLLIQRLKREVAELKQELSIARGEENGDGEELTEEAKEQCQGLVNKYVARNVDVKEPFVCGSVHRMRICFRILRDMCLGSAGGSASRQEEDPLLEMEAQKLRLEIAQRDAEIAMMVQMLSKRKAGSASSTPFIEAPAAAEAIQQSSLLKGQLPPASPPPPPRGASGGGGGLQPRGAAPSASSAPGPSSGPGPGSGPGAGQPAPKAPSVPTRRERPQPAPLPAGQDAAKLLLDQQQALEVFRTSVYRPPAAFEENKQLLKDKFALAKSLGEQANAIREGINEAKGKLERLRTERAMTAGGFDDGTPMEDGPEELAELQVIDRLRAEFREQTAELRSVKGEVEMIQKMLHQNNIRMQKEFEQWFVGLRKQAQLNNLDDETKRELYEQITGTAAPRPPSAGLEDSSRSGGERAAAEQVQPASFAATPRTLPQGAAFKAGGHGSRLESQLSSYYASIGEAPPNSSKRG